MYFMHDRLEGKIDYRENRSSILKQSDILQYIDCGGVFDLQSPCPLPVFYISVLFSCVQGVFQGH